MTSIVPHKPRQEVSDVEFHKAELREFIHTFSRQMTFLAYKKLRRQTVQKGTFLRLRLAPTPKKFGLQ